MKKFNIFLVILLCLGWFTISQAQQFGTTGAPFLKIGVGARAVGMGTAFSGLSDDVNAMYWNPGGLGFIRSWELGLNYQKLFGDFEHYSLFYAHQIPNVLLGSASVGIGVLHLGMLENWDSTNGKMAAVSAGDVSDLAVLVPFAYRPDFITDKLAIGFNYKFIQNKLAGITSQAHGLDLGILFKTELTHWLAWSAGISFQNKTLKKVKFIEQPFGLPYRTRGGTAFQLAIADNHDLILSYDIVQSKDDELKHNFGIEYVLNLGGHRLGFRGGYRLIDEDLGKLSFSVGYGFDINTLSQGSYYSEMNYSFNDYNSQILGNSAMGSFIVRPTGLLPFKRLAPSMNEMFSGETKWLLTWQKAADYDSRERIRYFVVVDTSYARLERTVKNAKEIIKNFVKHGTAPNVLFYKLANGTQAEFQFEQNVDFRDFYWAVVAFNRRLKIRVATGSDIIGKFSNRLLPDIVPVSLEFDPVNFLTDNRYQGVLRGKVVGRIDRPCVVAIVDSTDMQIICKDTIPKLAPSDTFVIKGNWYAKKPGRHNLYLIPDLENSIAERNEVNNHLLVPFHTILFADIAPKDTVKLEELSYEHIELPTIPYIFFEPNSTEFSKNSLTGNETEPDSLLKLFGQRLYRDYPGLRIIVKGYYDPESEQALVGGKRLSLLRAEFIKQKLIDYGARESQVIISTMHDDRTPRLQRSSRQIDPAELAMLNEENRRVEIQLPDDLPPTKRVEYDKRFFAPRLILREKNEILSQKITFECEINSPTPIDSVVIFIRDNREDPFPIKIINFVELPSSNSFKIPIQWDGIKDNGMLIAFNKNFYYWVRVVDKNGKAYSSSMKQFFVQRSVIVKEKRIFALAKFNAVAPLHQFYLEQLDQVEAMMKTDPRIRVRFFGHTDVIGTEERNNQLSAARAMELANWLAKIIDFDLSLTDDVKAMLKERIDNPLADSEENQEKIAYYGRGEHSPLVAKNIVYGDNNAPQGRTLNRRVDIEIYREEVFEKPALEIEKNITFHPWYQFVVFPAVSEEMTQKFASKSSALHPSHSVIYRKNVYQSPVLIAGLNNFNFYAAGMLSAQQDTSVHDTVKTKVDTLADTTQNKIMLEDSSKTESQQDSVVAGAQAEEQKPDTLGIDPVLANRVRCIEVQDSLLWLGTDDGLLKWNMAKNSFILFRMDFAKYKNFTTLKYDPRLNALYVGTHKGLRIFKDGKWGKDINVWNGLSGNIINSIQFMDKNFQNVLIATNEGIDLLHNGKVSIFANMDHGLADDYVNSLHIDDENKIWACTNHGISYLGDDGKWKSFEGNQELPSDTVTCMIIDDDGNKWVGTKNGLHLFDKDNKLRKYSTFEYFDDLRIREILDLAKDNTGKIWCITKRGLSMYDKGVWYTYNYEDGLPSSYMNALHLSDDGKKFIGLNGGGVSIVK